jgi:hypothetical protein
MLVSLARRVERSLKEPAVPLPLPHASRLTPWRSFSLLLLLVTSIVCDNCVDCLVENLIDAGHVLAAAFHVTSAHLSSDSHPLLLGNGRKPLGLEKIDAGSFCSKIRLETNKDEGGIGAEV